MSALDVAGAVVWTTLAASLWCATFGWASGYIVPLTEDLQGTGFLVAIILTLASVYCIARLFGASA